MRINKVTEEDLNRGLFYFGCTRAHIFEPEKDQSNEAQLTFQDDPAFGQECHRRIKEAVKAAEKEGRAEFRSGQCTYKKLNDFLTRNGYPP